MKLYGARYRGKYLSEYYLSTGYSLREAVANGVLSGRKSDAVRIIKRFADYSDGCHASLVCIHLIESKVS